MTEAKRQDLYSIRRDLISAVLNLERALGIPPEKSAIRTRQERRELSASQQGNGPVDVTQHNMLR